MEVDHGRQPCGLDHLETALELGVAAARVVLGLTIDEGLDNPCANRNTDVIWQFSGSTEWKRALSPLAFIVSTSACVNQVCQCVLNAASALSCPIAFTRSNSDDGEQAWHEPHLAPPMAAQASGAIHGSKSSQFPRLLSRQLALALPLHAHAEHFATQDWEHQIDGRDADTKR